MLFCSNCTKFSPRQNFNIHGKAPVPKLSCISWNFIKKESLTPGISCEFCKIFKSTFFTEHPWMTTSILQQLLALYFAIIYSWQLSISGNSLVGEKIIIYLKDFTNFDFLFFILSFHFFHFLWQMPLCLVDFAKPMLYSKQPFCFLGCPFCWFGDT